MKCKVCGKTFPVTPVWLSIRKTCSRECYRKLILNVQRRPTKPGDPSSFFCPSCKTFKHKDEFAHKRGTVTGITSYCKRCLVKKTNEYAKQNKEKVSESRRRHYRCHPDVHAERRLNAKLYHPEWQKKSSKNSKAKAVSQLLDHYLISNMKRDGCVINAGTIELKRQQIIAKRTLKQLKHLIREVENESDRDVISGEQHKDEAVDEVYRGCEEAGHGGDCGLSA